MAKFRNVTLIGKDGKAVVATTAADLNNFQYVDGMTPVPDLPEEQDAPAEKSTKTKTKDSDSK